METDVSTLAKQTFAILVVDDERTLRFTLKESLSEEGYRVETAADCAEAMEKVEREEFHLALLDQKLPDGTGIELLKKIRSKRKDIQVVIMTAFGKFEQAVEATKAGCYEYVAKPFELDHMKLIIQNALAQTRLAEEVSRLRDVERRHAGSMLIVGGSSKLIKIIETIRKIAQTGTSTVMLQGETGVGKELLAREIHDQGPRRGGPFVEVNCSAFPENLLEMELFGFERGVFTDAKAMKKGLMELANGGTLFLDEIGEMSQTLQTKLLRALEMKRFRRVGGLADIHVETRIVAATNRDLKAMVEQGKFREDLFFRLDVIRVVVPPLRERPEDIEPLVTAFVRTYADRYGMGQVEVEPALVDAIKSHAWPGKRR